jgi:hypothetical protein
MSAIISAAQSSLVRQPHKPFGIAVLVVTAIGVFSDSDNILGCQLASSDQPARPTAFAENGSRATDRSGDSPRAAVSRKSDQADSLPDVPLSYADPATARWKVGVKVRAGVTDALNLYIAIPVPCDWPEQTVTVVSEDMPPSVGDVTYAMLDGGVRRQLIRIPVLKAGEQLDLNTVFRVTSSQINGPAVTSGFVKPDKKNKDHLPYLIKSRYITFENSKLRMQAASLARQQAEAWKQVEAIYDWVRDNIDQKEMPNSDSVKAFRKREGSEEDKVALFVAMCRSLDFPSRMVWVDGGCHAEFMLADTTGQTYWFPCNVTGLREFGSLSEPRIILQKGDNIKVPEKNARLKFVAEHLSCQGTTRPTVEFIRELLPDE